MGVFAPPAAPLAARVGATRAVTIALALIAVGGVARSVAPGAFAVIALTIPIGIGMGLGNALMVVAVKERFADRPLLVTGVYACSHPDRRGARDGARRAARRRRRLLARAAVRLLGWRPPARSPGGSSSTRNAPPSPVGRRARFPLRSPIAWLFVALFVDVRVRLLRLSAWLPDAFTRARLVGRARRAQLVFADQPLRDPVGADRLAGRRSLRAGRVARCCCRRPSASPPARR